ncbi:MAG: hypothetical protein ABFS19_13585 [Thermodesulfobacteriota bacterium]
MKKGIVSVLLAMTFAVASVSVGMAAKVKCDVKGVDGDTVTLTCKKADKLKAGDKVEVKTKKGGSAAIEGC